MPKKIPHIAETVQEEKPLVFTAQSCRNFHLRMLICKFVFEQGGVPLNPFNVFGYYLYELVPRNMVRNGNNNMMKRCDEIWVFGDISDGVLAEIRMFKVLNKPIRFFTISNNGKEIKEISAKETVFEVEIKKMKNDLVKMFV